MKGVYSAGLWPISPALYPSRPPARASAISPALLAPSLTLPALLGAQVSRPGKQIAPGFEVKAWGYLYVLVAVVLPA